MRNRTIEHFAKNKSQEGRIRVVSWNIAGLRKTLGLRKFFRNYDIVTLQETWVEKNKEGEWIAKLDKDFNWSMKAAIRENKKGRAKGGVAVGIRKSLEVGELKEWDYGIVIKDLKGAEEKSISLIVVYNNVKIETVLNKMKTIAEECVERGESVIVVGDLNARVGEWQIGTTGEREKGRKSVDKTLNSEGNKLLSFCEELGCTIRNGATKGDWEGEQIFVGDGGLSVIDLVI